MNKKAELGIGVIMVTFIAILVGVILFQAIAQEAGSATTTSDLVNVTHTLGANETTTYMDYRSLGGTVVISNVTTGLAYVQAGNLTITNNVIDPADGTLSVGILTGGTIASVDVYVTSAGSQEQTYIANSSARAVTGLIAIFFALAIAVIALEPTLRSGVLNAIGK